MKGRRWTINGDFLGLAPNGVKRYAREITLALDGLMKDRHELTKDLEIELISPVPPREDVSLDRIGFRFVKEFNKPRLPQFWVQSQLPFYINGGLLSFCNLAPVITRKQIICIHDLQSKLMPESYGFFFRLANSFILPLLGRGGATITTVSEFSRQHLVQSGIASPAKIFVTYNGSDHALRWLPENGTLDLDSVKPFVICLGRAQKYKNTDLFWKIAGDLDAIGVDILMAGDMKKTNFDTLGSCRPGNLRFLGRIGDDDFAQALSKALCFLLPSRIEGFGLPAVEAMALGCPVVASTSPCLPEVCGDAALYADPDDLPAWVSAIARLKTDRKLRRDLIAAGRSRARDFSWRRIAENYLRLMLRIDTEPSP